MRSPTSGRGRADPANRAAAHFDGGLRYEQAGIVHKAVEAYEGALAASADPLVQAEAHLRLARVYRTQSRLDAAVDESRAAVRLADAAGSDDLAAEAMNVEVGVHEVRGDFSLGDAVAAAALTRARQPRVRGILLQNRGAIAAQRGDFGTASEYFAESVDAFRASDYELGMTFALNNASAAARDGDDPAAALAFARRAASLARHLDALDMLTLAVQNQAQALVDLGRVDEAEEPLGEALGHYTATANVFRQAECLELMGALYAARPGYADTAERCFERARDLADRAGARGLVERLDLRLADIGGAAAQPA